MKSLALSQFNDLHLTVFGLLIFFSFFLTVVAWTSLKENKKKYKQIEKLPFEDGEKI